MDIHPIYHYAVGIDVHLAILMVCVILQGGDGAVQVWFRQFGSFRRDRLAMARWIAGFQPDTVVMESTGVYWKSPYAFLEWEGIRALVVNAQHVKQIRGRKTDMNDAEWLAVLGRSSLLRGSFIPPENLRHLRHLRQVSRYHQRTTATLATEKNRLVRVLSDAGIRLSAVVSDLHGTAATAMIDCLLDGGTPDDALALAGRLHAPREEAGTWLFLENPRVGVCRRLTGEGAAEPFPIEPKERLHLLFVVSRPEGEGFFDPRADPQAVMDALERRAPGRITVELLRPPTLGGLIERLEDERLPSVDVLHFDGHGVYDSDGALADAARALTAGLPGHFRQVAEAGAATQQGYLLFEDKGDKRHPVSALLFGDMLNQQRVPLVVLSACQSAKVGGDDPLGSVAARLTRAGISAVLAMTHSVLVATTAALFGHLYGELGRGRTLGTALDNAHRGLYRDPQRGERRRGEAWITLKLQDWFVPALYRTGSDAALCSPRPCRERDRG
jgi:Transposase/CHAT domain